MELLIIIAFGAAIYWLWQRVDSLQRRIDQLEWAQSAAAEQVAEEPVASVALVRSVAEDVAQSEILPEPEPEPEPERETSLAREALPADDPPFVSVEPAAADIAEQFGNEPEPAAEPDPEPEPEPAKRSFDFEEIFGRRLPIWVGGITLAIAGILLVRYSIDAGLVTPSVRVAMAFVFGIALLAGAEFAHRKADLVGDPRICQALAGAGLATLYAGFYLAGSQYGLIGQTLAFLGLAGVTAAAIALSFRFGLPCAILGLVGGFAAPLLVGGEEANLPLLTIYLGLVTVGLTQAGERQGRPWLSLAALAAGLGWGALLLLSENVGTAEILALGFYLLLLGAVLPSLVTGGSFARPVRLASALVASLQLALLVDRAGDGLLAWGLYLLMGATLAGLAWKRAELREASAVAMVIAIGLLTQWDPVADWTFYALVAGAAPVFAGVPALHIWLGRATIGDRIQVAAGSLGLMAATYVVVGEPFAPETTEWRPAITALLLAAFPLAAAIRARRDGEATGWAALFSTSAALLVLISALLVTPSWTAPIVAAIVLGVLLLANRRRSDNAATTLISGGCLTVLLLLFGSAGFEQEFENLFTGQQDGIDGRAILRWAAVSLALGAAAWRAKAGRAFDIGQIGAALAGYGLAAQILPADTLPWLAAFAVGAFGFARFAADPACWALLGVAGLWALLPLMEWSATGIEAGAGAQTFLLDWPTWRDALLRILPFGAAAAALGWRGGEAREWSVPYVPGPALFWAAGAALLVTLHILYKQIFGIETQTSFIANALAERTIWQALLIGGAAIALRPLPRIGAQPAMALALTGLALAHLVWFTGVVHNPLFTAQAVGPVPIANLALAAGVVALAALWLIRGMTGLRGRQAVDALAMIAITVTALALLRQMFSGSILTAEPMGQTEDLLRSVMGIALAIGFLLIGRMRGEQSWRIGSLVLMLLAVAKVFLIDAAALEGLLRIASFMALGFSLLGIGWLYARQLGTKGSEAETEADSS